MSGMGKFLEGKKALVFGVANDRSIAWGISEALHKAGAKMAFTYMSQLESRVRPLAESLNAEIIEPCDVTNDADLDKSFKVVEDKWGGLDILIHAVAYANREDLEGRFVDTTREGFRLALEISAYSLVAMAKRAEPLMKNGGNIMAMTYYGAEKVIPNYNVMGVAKSALESSVRYLAADMGPKNIRVNAISAGPIKTLASSGIAGFKKMLGFCAERSPLGRNVTQEDVANNALYLCSDLSSGVTGEVIYVDSGYNIIGL
jgi:enoyl-[acyl-carrier protein] reductase I